MVKLRLARFGKKGQPTYRLIAIQARDKRQGEAIEYLGHYNPRTKPSTLVLDADRIKYWLGVGAQPTETVSYLLAREGLMEVAKKQYKSKPGRKRQEQIAAEEAAAAKA